MEKSFIFKSIILCLRSINFLSSLIPHSIHYTISRDIEASFGMSCKHSRDPSDCIPTWHETFLIFENSPPKWDRSHVTRIIRCSDITWQGSLGVTWSQSCNQRFLYKLRPSSKQHQLLCIMSSLQTPEFYPSFKSDLISPPISYNPVEVKEEFSYQHLLFGGAFHPPAPVSSESYQDPQTTTNYPAWYLPLVSQLPPPLSSTDIFPTVSNFHPSSDLHAVSTYKIPLLEEGCYGTVERVLKQESDEEVNVELENVPELSQTARPDLLANYSLEQLSLNMPTEPSYIPYFLGGESPFTIPPNLQNPTSTPPTSTTPSSCRQPDESCKFSDQTNLSHQLKNQRARSGKIKRARTEFTQAHLDRLEEKYAQDHYSRGSTRDDLAEELKVTPRAVTIWFQNRRARDRADKNNAWYLRFNFRRSDYNRLCFKSNNLIMF